MPTRLVLTDTELKTTIFEVKLVLFEEFQVVGDVPSFLCNPVDEILPTRQPSCKYDFFNHFLYCLLGQVTLKFKVLGVVKFWNNHYQILLILWF